LENDAGLYLSEASQAQAQQTLSLLQRSVVEGESIARQFSENRRIQGAWGVTEADFRQFSSHALAVQAKASSAFGLALAFEPDSTQDPAFLNQPFAGNERGRFAVYQSAKTSGYTIAEKELQDDGTAATFWYNCPLKQGRTCITEPYAYTDAAGASTLMTTVAVPLLDRQRAIGTLSLDISLASLQDHAVQSASSLYHGAARVLLVSPRGVIAADSQSPDNLGKPLATLDARLAQALSTDNQALLELDDDLLALSSFPGSEGGHWTTLIRVPRQTVLMPQQQLAAALDDAQEHSMRTQLWLTALLAIVSLGLIAWLGHAISRPIRTVAEALDEIAEGEGDLTRR
ncbi:PDC sensor domain-containing protein, partial [Streptomyces olivaceus]